MAGSGGVGAKSAPLSCQQCRRRKIKCDRGNPCSFCVRIDVQCIPHTPSHAPRGRQGGRPKNNEELLQRIAKLENLVQEIESSNDGPTVKTEPEGQHTPHTTGPESVGSEPTSQPQDSRLSSGETSIDRYLGRSLWITLGQQIQGLREVLDLPSDEDDESGTPLQSSHSSTPAHAGLENFIICGSEIIALDATILQHPSQTLANTLCDTYLSNVDRIIKILYAPSIRRFLCAGADQLVGSPGPRGLEALRFAMFYAATTSLTAPECQHKLGEDRATLLARFRCATELALARADFVNTTEMSTLQALVIFVIAIRCNDQTRLPWTLVGLITRIAQALGLHRETCIAPYPPFHREMRRRLWWRICVVDNQSASDRGTDPVIIPGCFNTRMPLRINDSDISPDDDEEPKERDEFTDMTFSLVCSDVFDTVRRLNHVPADVLPVPETSTRHDSDLMRREWVVRSQTLVEERIMRHCNLNDPFQYSTRMVADIIIALMWLIAYRPLQQHPSCKMSNTMSHPDILRLCVEVLEKSHHINTSLFTKSVWWISKTYVQWHPLAVALAELCVQTEGPIVDRAWNVIHVLYNDASQQVAEGEKGLLWRPIKKLMTRALSMRRAGTSNGNVRAENVADLGSNVSMHDIAFNTAEATSTPAMAGFQGVSMPQGHGTTSVPANEWGQFDWSPWLTLPQTTQDFSSSVVDQAATANWENFLSDFQVDDGFPQAF